MADETIHRMQQLLASRFGVAPDPAHGGPCWGPREDGTVGSVCEIPVPLRLDSANRWGDYTLTAMAGDMFYCALCPRCRWAKPTLLLPVPAIRTPPPLGMWWCDHPLHLSHLIVDAATMRPACGSGTVYASVPLPCFMLRAAAVLTNLSASVDLLGRCIRCQQASQESIGRASRASVRLYPPMLERALAVLHEAGRPAEDLWRII